jgi:hypothetical protein
VSRRQRGVRARIDRRHQVRCALTTGHETTDRRATIAEMTDAMIDATIDATIAEMTDATATIDAMIDAMTGVMTVATIEAAARHC